MRRPTRLWLSILAPLLVFSVACANTFRVIPELGPAFADRERDPEGSEQRAAEYDRVCVAPSRQNPPRISMAPMWCIWTIEADKVIRANNAKRRD